MCIIIQNVLPLLIVFMKFGCVKYTTDTNSNNCTTYTNSVFTPVLYKDQTVQVC